MLAASTALLKGASTVRIAYFDASGKPTGVKAVEKIVKTDAEWKAQLTPEQFYVTRQKGTERAGTGKYANNHYDGIYSCICCGTPLFDSKTKFESGTGWPSYWQPIEPKAVATEEDNTLFTKRTEVLCSRCNGHLGHVFDDGPKPTGLRYCINGYAMTFEKKKE